MASELSDKEVHNRQQDLSQDPQQEIISKGDNTQILIINIPESATEESIQKTFEKFGKILKIKIIQDMEGKPNGEALIEFATKQEKDLVLNSNEEFELEGKKIEVKDPSNEGLTLFVGNIPYTAREEDVVEFFSECGKVHVKFFYINNSFKGYAYVTFQDENAVETALKKIKIEKLKSRNSINMQRGRRGGYRGSGGRGRGGPPFGQFDRERKEDYFRERRDRYRDLNRGRPYNRPRDREREWNRDRRERSRDRSREYSRIRDRGEKNRNDRGERERDRHREYERDRERDRGDRGDRGDRERDRGERGDRGDRGDRERDREREKENERHREYERERINRDNRERERDREKRHSNYDTDKW